MNGSAEPNPERSPMAVAMAWVSTITTVAFEMVLPGVAGVWLDGKLGTLVLFTVLGFGLGLTLAIWHLMRVTNRNSANVGDTDVES